MRWLALSPNEKRKVMLRRLDDLAALQEVVLAEPIPGVTCSRPVSPR